MDEHTEIFIALGAATAANCGPCFEHYFSKAEKLGIAKGDIRKTVDIAVKVRGGAHMVMNRSIRKTMTYNDKSLENCCD
jgi:alkylhydroperoxidase/carboxymuconolactone decarboxylase family protein YurZ